MNQATVILEKLKLPDILEKVLSYERDRKTALLRSKGFGNNNTNDNNHNSKGEDSCHNSRDQDNNHNSKGEEDNGERINTSTVRSSQLPHGNESSGSQITDFVRTEISNDAINKKKQNISTIPTMNENEEEGRTSPSSSSAKKNSTSLLDMFQLNDNEENDDPIWNHFKNTKSQSLNNNNKNKNKNDKNNDIFNKSQRTTDEIESAQHHHKFISSTQQQKQRQETPVHCSTRDNSPIRNSGTHATKRRQNIVDSPPDLDDLDNDPIWQRFTNSNTNHEESNSSSTALSKEPVPKNNKHHSQQIGASALADTVLIPSYEKIIPDFTNFPSSSRKKKKKEMTTKDLVNFTEERSSSFSLNHLTDGNNKTSESQLVERVLDAQTPRSKENLKEQHQENLNIGTATTTTTMNRQEHQEQNQNAPTTTPNTTTNRFKRFTFRKKVEM